MDSAGFKLKEKRDQGCTDAINKIPTIDSVGKEYKDAVLKCMVGSYTFRKKADKLKLKILTGRENDTEYDAKKSKPGRKKAFVTFYSNVQIDSVPTNVWKNGVSGTCNATEDNLISNSSEAAWNTFVLACVKEDDKLEDILKRDFWSGEKKEDIMKRRINNAGFTLKEANKQDCQKKTEDLISLEISNTKYKEAILTCIDKDKAWKDKAENLGLKILDTSTIKNNPEDTQWKEKWESYEEEIKSLDTNKGKSWKQISEAEAEIKKLCNKKTTKISDNNPEKDWQNFLKICTIGKASGSEKLKEAISRDFWTGDLITN